MKSAACYGVTLWEREGDTVVIDVLGRREEYVQLASAEFTSDRKRMSVILRNTATNALVLYCKGADDMVMRRLAPGQEALVSTVQAQIDSYATAGLRTLVMSYRDMSEAEYAEFKAAFDEVRGGGGRGHDRRNHDGGGISALRPPHPSPLLRPLFTPPPPPPLPATAGLRGDDGPRRRQGARLHAARD